MGGRYHVVTANFAANVSVGSKARITAPQRSRGSPAVADIRVGRSSRNSDGIPQQASNDESSVAQKAAYDVCVCLARGHAAWADVALLRDTRIGVIE